MKTNSGLSRQELIETRKQLQRQIKALKRFPSAKNEIAEIEDKLESIRRELCLRSFSIAEEMGVTA